MKCTRLVMFGLGIAPVKMNTLLEWQSSALWGVQGGLEWEQSIPPTAECGPDAVTDHSLLRTSTGKLRKHAFTSPLHAFHRLALSYMDLQQLNYQPSLSVTFVMVRRAQLHESPDAIKSKWDTKIQNNYSVNFCPIVSSKH